MQIRIRDTEACEPQPLLLWDTVWIQRLDASGGYGDWIMAGAGDQTASRGGLRAESALHTATLLALFTDRRCPEDEDLPSDDPDPRGWWGDSVRIEGEPESETGSLLWLLERAVLNEATARRAETYAREALGTLIDQGAVAATDVTATADPRRGALEIVVVHYDRTGARAYEQRFGVLWAQSARGAPMMF